MTAHTAFPVPNPAVPITEMTTGALQRYRTQLERSLRRCSATASRRDALRESLADVLAEETERRRITRSD